MVTLDDQSDIGTLPTEQRNDETSLIDTRSTIEMVALLNRQDASVAGAVEQALGAIADSIDVIADRLRDGGRLIYIGAGTSGRLGVLDASECPPTFNTPPNMVVGIIAGGDVALRHPVENLEDQPEAGASALREISLTPNDVVVGIAASGRTPFVVGSLAYAQQLGAHTISLSNVSDSRISRHADIDIAMVTGAEPITGSTRMKAGTAQKMVLNMLSTGAMIKLGKTYGNLMVDVQPSNEKLRNRAVRIVAAACETDVQTADALLERSGHDVKTAIIMGVLTVDSDKARAMLEQSHGVVRDALAESV